MESPGNSYALLGDLGHILQASGCGATVDSSIATDLMEIHAYPSKPDTRFDLETAMETRLGCVLAGGDDYELLFTALPSERAAVLAAGAASATRVTCIGRIEAAPGVRVVDAVGQPVSGRFASFDHFA